MKVAVDVVSQGCATHSSDADSCKVMIQTPTSLYDLGVSSLAFIFKLWSSQNNMDVGLSVFKMYVGILKLLKRSNLK